MMRVNDQFLCEVFVIEELLSNHISLTLSIQKVSDVSVVITHETLFYLFNLD